MRVIGGRAKGRRLQSPKGPGVRPTSDRVREALFNILSPRIAGCSFLDLCAGTGAVGIEALSRGAESATFVEKDAKTASLIRKNLEATGLADRAAVWVMDFRRALTELGRKGQRFDIVFVDPPYRLGQEDAALTELAAGNLLVKGGLVVTESDSSHLPAAEVENLFCWRREKYGDTTLSFYRIKEA
ncbi:16S rRNA (guanine(966)-N(2))-methyltransferase RsmD [Desulforudis sp. 1088]|uniref:16S rRNA (guanine(966)-N(2))-methyltransferase RsmD n=1 Tax=unclassified Candidatus Desulforudis TaxID=2635950 RepID=UPI003CE4FF6C